MAVADFLSVSFELRRYDLRRMARTEPRVFAANTSALAETTQVLARALLTDMCHLVHVRGTRTWYGIWRARCSRTWHGMVHPLELPRLSAAGRLGTRSRLD